MHQAGTPEQIEPWRGEGSLRGILADMFVSSSHTVLRAHFMPLLFFFQ